MHTVILYRDGIGEWRWRREAKTGDIVSDSGEGYKNFKDCREMAIAVNSEANFVLENVSEFLAEDDALREQTMQLDIGQVNDQ